MDDDTFYYSQDTDLDLSFTSTTTDRTFGSSSARSSLARSSLTLSFNERISTGACTTHTHHQNIIRPHRREDPHWSAIRAATNLSPDGRLHLRNLKLLRILGTGNLGRVFLCRIRDYHHSSPNSHFALKVVDKDSLSPKKLSHVQTEAEILSMLDHPFLPTLYAHVEVSHYTCLLIDYCSGGDLHSLLRKQPSYRLPASAVKFYAAEVLVALEYLHSLGIVYRDLKPENILIKEDGHIMLSDFDLCFKSDVTAKIEKLEGQVNRTGSIKSRKSRRFDRTMGDEFVAEPTGAFSKSCVGTHEYLAPELVSGNGHGNGVDWWGFGVLIYELLYGTTPFKGVNKEATLRNIASSRDVRFGYVEERDIEDDKDMAAAKDLIEKLLVKDPSLRMGAIRGAAEIKKHPFFNGVKWALIRSYRAPEVRGGLVRKSKSHVSVVHRRQKWWWRSLNHLLRKNKGSKVSHNNSSISCGIVNNS
ncbi:serine/threonine-protein kinase WAG1-like [Chenopodium quinoa]|uniref:serine/threonine-protein kinase WAG1-like n=1 Tax=Chenopodium quinoa TaxID=63459 RepID=UPI000B76E121|nr:serine/threonine-protein kinase WAG1-like [Chenopodium quinoa]